MNAAGWVEAESLMVGVAVASRLPPAGGCPCLCRSCTSSPAGCLSWWCCSRAATARRKARDLRIEGIKVIRTPIQAPNANAHAERWVRTLGADCLDRILILGRRHLEHVLRVYRRDYNEHRPHRALDLFRPTAATPMPLKAPDRLQRRDLLG